MEFIIKQFYSASCHFLPIRSKYSPQAKNGRIVRFLMHYHIVLRSTVLCRLIYLKTLPQLQTLRCFEEVEGSGRGLLVRYYPSIYIGLRVRTEPGTFE
jgi:hypothetical protein